MKDKQITEKFGIPKGTIYEWKNSQGYRKDLYFLLKNLDKIIDCEKKEDKIEEIRLRIKS